MSQLWNYLNTVYAVIAIIPVIPFFTVLICYSLFTGDRKKAMRVAMDITVFFLIGVVAALFNMIFGGKFGFFGILLLMVLAGGFFGNLQYRKRGKADPVKIIKMVWRISFFVLGSLYLLLAPIMLIKYIFFPS